MADQSMQTPDEGESAVIQLDSEIPVNIDSLEADGVRPSVGDTVTLTVEGTVKSIENDCVYIVVDKVNDTDLAELLAEHQQGGDGEDQMMKRLTSEADQSGTPVGGGY